MNIGNEPLNRWIFDPPDQGPRRTAFMDLLGYAADADVAEYDGFFKALKQTLLPAIVDFNQPLQPPNGNTLFILRTYGDLAMLHQIITANWYETRVRIFQTTRQYFSHQFFSTNPGVHPLLLYDSLIQNSIELVVWIWLMIALRADSVLDGALPPAVGGRNPHPWRQDMTIDQAVFSSLNPFSSLNGIQLPLAPPAYPPGRIVLEEDMDKDHDREFSWLLNLRDIERLSRTRVQWTDNLLDHLLMQTDPSDKFGQIVYIFDHSKWLRQAENAPPGTRPFYQDVAREALQTLALLIPPDEPHDNLWYVNECRPSRGPGGMWLYFVQDDQMRPRRRVHEYHIWRHRLLILEAAFGSSSSTFRQLFRDQRNNNQRWTFCVTCLSFVAAALLLLLTVALVVLTGILTHDTHKTLEDTEAAGANSTSNPAYYCCPAGPCCSTTTAANGTMPSLASMSFSQSSATAVSSGSTTVYPDTYSRYDVLTGAIDYDTQYGEIHKQPGSDDITTLLNFKFPNQTSGHTCQFAFWLGSNTSHSGSQEFDIFTSNAQPIEDTDSWPYGNLRNTFAGRMMFGIVPGFAGFEAGYTDQAQQFPCPGGQMAGFELVGVNDEVSILWDKTTSGPYIVSNGE